MTTSSKDIIELLSDRTSIPWYRLQSILDKLDYENLQDLKCIIEDVYEAGNEESCGIDDYDQYRYSEADLEEAKEEGYAEAMAEINSESDDNAQAAWERGYECGHSDALEGGL